MRQSDMVWHTSAITSQSALLFSADFSVQSVTLVQQEPIICNQAPGHHSQTKVICEL